MSEKRRISRSKNLPLLRYNRQKREGRGNRLKRAVRERETQGRFVYRRIAADEWTKRMDDRSEDIGGRTGIRDAAVREVRPGNRPVRPLVLCATVGLLTSPTADLNGPIGAWSVGSRGGGGGDQVGRTGCRPGGGRLHGAAKGA